MVRNEIGSKLINYFKCNDNKLFIAKTYNHKQIQCDPQTRRQGCCKEF